MAQLHDWFEKARNGERHIVFISGEPGIGKTTLVNALLAQIAAESNVHLARGYCIEHYGPGEAYLPVLEALGQLGREVEPQQFVSLLRQHAPVWLAQLPSLLPPAEQERLQRELQGTTRERMLRELASWLNVFTEQTMLVLVLEDLHWSDASTLELLTFVARQQTRARLLIIGSYRPEEIGDIGSPLRALLQELHAHQLCHELRLERLSEAAVEDYLTMRFPISALPTRLAPALHRRTEGNPLFLVNLVEELIAQGVLAPTEDGIWTLQEDLERVTGRVPQSIRALIEKQIERLTALTRRVLTTASLVGSVFAAEVVAVAADLNVAEVETQCEELARREQFLRCAGIETWPDGTITARYGFQHAVHQQLWHEQVMVSQQQELHLRIGLRKEQAYNGQVETIAAELMVHFEQGREVQRAAYYRGQVAQLAIRRGALQEAMQHLTKGLELLAAQPISPQRSQQEFSLQTHLVSALMVTKGYAAQEAYDVHMRIQELSQQVEDDPQLALMLITRWGFQLSKPEYGIAWELAQQIGAIATQLQRDDILLSSYLASGVTLLYLGAPASARAPLEQATLLYASHRQSPQASPYPKDQGAICPSYAALVLWLLGFPEQALKKSQEGMTWARELPHPFILAPVLTLSAELHHLRGEARLAQGRAEEGIALSTQHGLTPALAGGRFWRGWSLAIQGRPQEGISQMRQALTEYQIAETNLGRPYLLALLAATCEQVQQPEEGLVRLTEALVLADQTGERHYEAELYRLKGELTLQKFQGLGSKSQVRKRPKAKVTDPQSLISNPQAKAEACFHKAIEIARRQNAKSLELRATMSLARLWRQQGKQAEARQLLMEIYSWFTEGFDTADLRAAKEVLDELA